jgi:hypothetical protein
MPMATPSGKKSSNPTSINRKDATLASPSKDATLASLKHKIMNKKQLRSQGWFGKKGKDGII